MNKLLLFFKIYMHMSCNIHKNIMNTHTLETKYPKSRQNLVFFYAFCYHQTNKIYFSYFKTHIRISFSQVVNSSKCRKLKNTQKKIKTKYHTTKIFPFKLWTFGFFFLFLFSQHNIRRRIVFILTSPKMQWHVTITAIKIKNLWRPVRHNGVRGATECI